MALLNNDNEIYGFKFHISKVINLEFDLFFLFLSHLNTDKETFQWLNCTKYVIYLFICSKIVLITLLISEFDELISLNDELGGKFS